MKEVWRGVTLNAAKALGCDADIGSIEVGKQADLVIWSCDNLDDIVYQTSINRCETVVKSGRVV